MKSMRMTLQSRTGLTITIGVVLWCLVEVQPLFALILEEAKSKGLVGELSDG